jgi:hypothetical protein
VLDAAMKQYKALSPETAALFFTVDQNAGKIVCMSCTPKVNHLVEYVYSKYKTCDKHQKLFVVKWKNFVTSTLGGTAWVFILFIVGY